MTDAPRDPRQRERATDNGRIAKLADSPHSRLWPRVVTLIMLPVIAYLLSVMLTDMRADIAANGDGVTLNVRAINELTVFSAIIKERYETLQGSHQELRTDVRRLEGRVGPPMPLRR